MSYPKPVRVNASLFASAVIAMLLYLSAAGAVAADSNDGFVPLRVVVTGDPATAGFVSAEIDAAITRALTGTIPADSVARAVTIAPLPQALERGFLTDYTVGVAVESNGVLGPLTGTRVVEVQNADLPAFSPLTLAFRDDPERIVADGVLSRTIVDTEHPTRLYYYHENRRVARRFCVVLSANGSVRTHVQVIAAAAGPNMDVMSVGHAVTKTFLQRKPRNEGNVIEVAGGRPVIVRDTPVGSGNGIVGATDVRVLDGGPLTLTVMAIPSAADPADYLYTAKLPNDGHDRHGDFDLAGFGRLIIGYSGGDQTAAYVYGRRTRTPAGLEPADSGRDYGDYGVLQQVSFDLDNARDETVTFYLYEKPLGGVVRSSFVVSGQLIEMGCVRVAQRYTVTSLTLAEHAAATVDVLTMTDGGSNYPLEIGFTTTPPLMQVPVISARDGCFPKPARIQPLE